MKISFTHKILIVLLVGSAIFVGLILRLTPKKTPERGLILTTADTALPLEGIEAGVGLPVRLKIPTIDVDAGIDYVGLSPDGRMDVPKGPATAAWYSYGPRPGDVGSSVIDGHSGYKDDKPGVFDDLYKLSKGDKIYVEDSKGITSLFVVRESESYDKDKDVPDVFNSNDGQAHLNLITCGGDWNEREKTHSTRLVVFADKETPQ